MQINNAWMVQKHWQEAPHDVGNNFYYLCIYQTSYLFLSCEGPLYPNVAKLGACEKKREKNSLRGLHSLHKPRGLHGLNGLLGLKVFSQP
jgi:hypothetical protein